MFATFANVLRSSFDPYPSMGEEKCLNIPGYHSYIKPAQWQKHSEQVVTTYDLVIFRLFITLSILDPLATSPATV